ncbi:hypothetical protein AAFF_G00371560 [Aldrovandia affinis]|uniref:Ig-like domain-containing protein n=1 Tax=Aldrovandia affinis TaxID=143900 RepID=A0AAD7SIV8_9TELE|nr:hypothetical protein AAFF_G00371560 [Aldrovandia affinis]
MDPVLKTVVVTLLVLSDLAQGNEEPCEYKAVGESMTIPLQRQSQCEEDSLSWKFSSKQIFYKKGKDIRTGKPSDITADGSLLLTDLQVDNAGTYKAELHGTDGKLCGRATADLCVIDPVQLSVRVMSPNQVVREGGEVSILCNSTPPADKYLLWSPKSESLFLESAVGEFRLKKVSKDDEGLYTCRPQWTPGPRLMVATSQSNCMFSPIKKASLLMDQRPHSMASGGSASLSVTLLFFTTFTKGNFGIQLGRVDSINATVGQRVNLSCLMEKEQDSSIGQIMWRKFVKGQEDQILLDLKAQDSGDYICELTTFPLGTMKTNIHLWVTDVQLSARVTWPNGGVREGDNVTILCNSTPPADFYSLWPSKNKTSIFKSKEGRFTLHKVTRTDSDLYVCQPGNSASGLSFHGHSVTVPVPVDYPVQLSIRVMSPDQGVREGGEVSILCNSTPPADKYLLWSPKSESLFLESAGGEFRLQKVSKDDGGLYTCRPQWTPGPPFDGGNVTVELHVLPQRPVREIH